MTNPRIQRRHLGRWLAVAALAVGTFAQAQTWPTKGPIKIVIPYPPGGASDVTARVLAALPKGAPEAQVNEARKAAVAAVEKECSDKTGQRCDVVDAPARASGGAGGGGIHIRVRARQRRDGG